MGQFSYIAVDTKTPIFCQPIRPQIVKMVWKDPYGDISLVQDRNYEGYGRFGCVNDIVEEMECEAGTYPQLFLGVVPDLSTIDFTVKYKHDPDQGWGEVVTLEDMQEYWRSGGITEENIVKFSKEWTDRQNYDGVPPYGQSNPED